ncbi:MAG: hypothetical protein HFJ49_01490 [Clostridia bacterium]|nr:hypothetical protein [Clostridia bacterium]
MELKTKFQYTYFIHSYKIRDNKYSKYIQRLLKNPKCKLKIFEKHKDIGIYNFFTPKVRNYMFSTFDFTKSKIRRLEELPVETKAAILSKEPCIMFEYDIEKDIQGKAGEQKGIFFKIRKVEIVCFNTGICMLSLKTDIENSEYFSDVLNFNYKFNKLNSEEALVDYDKIRIQTDKFEGALTFKKFIDELTGGNLAEVGNIDTQEYLTFAYTCIDQSYWSNAMDFERIKSDYIKYVKVLPNDNSVSYSSFGMTKIIDKWNYAKLGITKSGVTLLTSSIDLNNYTVLPQDFENQYLYAYMLLSYMKIYLRMIKLEFRQKVNIKSTRKKLLQFTKELWIQEITNDDIGTLYYHNLKEVLELDNLYFKVKNQYDLVYKELNVEKNIKTNVIITIILVTTLILNIVSYFALIKK